MRWSHYPCSSPPSVVYMEPRTRKHLCDTRIFAASTRACTSLRSVLCTSTMSYPEEICSPLSAPSVYRIFCRTQSLTSRGDHAVYQRSASIVSSEEHYPCLACALRRSKQSQDRRNSCLANGDGSVLPLACIARGRYHDARGSPVNVESRRFKQLATLMLCISGRLTQRSVMSPTSECTATLSRCSKAPTVQVIVNDPGHRRVPVYTARRHRGCRELAASVVSPGEFSSCPCFVCSPLRCRHGHVPPGDKP
ncbi:hypothetical protein PLICRDRAFT_533949 [Plicaturopsis crispa FD-325 SS-3]|nr:hypothetical protein PLICRDRAFT_533949 [Plicaturopsis crispa FD-325 SS-3]